MPRLFPLAPLVLIIVGCTQFPEIDARVPEAERTGPPPALIDVVPLLAQADAARQSQRVTPESAEDLAARAAVLATRPVPNAPATGAARDARLQALTARAEALRAAPVIDPSARDRLDAGVTPPAALQ
ncbi:hypothetical protein CLV79_104229 [Limimaricola soesokkakensis]|uniref:Uncharacterized protein n=1 Tax=Limimaricola soesokkakensis TaxID=1343159 RepID=A0A1X6Z533_9RHOB|nr:hypothetical protein [Limimaricola soesokkakensis]PSK86797.1 hypothetical protein CLV79_104229 [Limimaricola soesokkakensis]SLN41298.1 hypothetical protein LOS8367_01722 [Limimaricola soesokkakensis]